MSNGGLVARFKQNGFTNSAIDLLIKAYISGRRWFAHVLTSQVGSGSLSDELYEDFVIISLTPNV